MLGDFPNLLKRDEVYEIIERYPDERDFCELQLQKLVPPTIYHRLLTEIYPALAATSTASSTTCATLTSKRLAAWSMSVPTS